MFSRSKIVFIGVVAVALLSGCNEPGPKTQTGAAVGVVGGTVLGGIIGGRNGALTGAVLGGITGAAIGGNEDRKDRRYYRDSYGRTYYYSNGRRFYR